MYLESNGDIVSHFSNAHCIATNRVNVIGRNLASAPHYRECMLRELPLAALLYRLNNSMKILRTP